MSEGELVMMRVTCMLAGLSLLAACGGAAGGQGATQAATTGDPEVAAVADTAGQGDGAAEGAPTAAAAPSDAANPLLGTWLVVSLESCGTSEADFTADTMVLRHPATRFDAAYDSTTHVYYQVNPGEVIVHDNETVGGNAPAYEFDGPDQIRLGGTDGGCTYRRAR